MSVWIMAATSWYLPGYPATIQPPALWPMMTTRRFCIVLGCCGPEQSLPVVVEYAPLFTSPTMSCSSSRCAEVVSV